MHINDSYTLTTLHGHTYLLPFGQNISMHRHGLELNEVSILLWQALCDGADEDDLLNILREHYQADETDLPLLKEDISEFLLQLRALDILDLPSITPPENFTVEASISHYAIAELYIDFRLPSSLIPKEFTAFEAAGLPDDQTADLTIDVFFQQPAYRPVGEVLVRSDDLVIMECESCYTLLFPTSPDLIECHMAKDASYACFYCRDIKSETYSYELFHGVRFVYLYLARMHGKFAIHSASFLYKDRAWLFSAVSGTGKSTHTNLWKELYEDEISLLNGDLNLIGFHDNTPVVYGIPWCGTSEIFTTKKYPLGGIILLRRNPSDQIEQLPEHQKQLLICQRFISPNWTADMLKEQLDFAGSLLPRITCFRLWCTKEFSAARLCRSAIDDSLTI